MKSALHKILVLCCALYLSGAHWVALQTTAWTGMVISRTLTTSVADAIQTTFDGHHPCSMCSAIAEGKQTEHQSEQNFDLLKKIGALKFLELAPLELEHECFVNQAAWPASVFHVLTRSEAPPTPPPLA